MLPRTPTCLVELATFGDRGGGPGPKPRIKEAKHSTTSLLKGLAREVSLRTEDYPLRDIPNTPGGDHDARGKPRKKPLVKQASVSKWTDRIEPTPFGHISRRQRGQNGHNSHGLHSVIRYRRTKKGEMPRREVVK
jgi:hypothetical protein